MVLKFHLMLMLMFELEFELMLMFELEFECYLEFVLVFELFKLLLMEYLMVLKFPSHDKRVLR